MSALAHTGHPVAAPVSDASLSCLISSARAGVGARLLDLGCGAAEWSLRALELVPDSHADGVDVSATVLGRARERARSRRLDDRITLHHADMRKFHAQTDYELVLCVGSAHALDGLAATLEFASTLLRPGGALVVGDGFWARPPGKAALRALGAEPADFRDLAGTVEAVEDAGWTPVYAHVSDAAEWDDYEWSWTGALTRWALDHPDHPDADEVLGAAREHREGWLRGYRDVLGFVCFVLRRAPGW